MNSYITVSGESSAEYTEKRSRFIATVRPCTTEEEATAFIEEMRSQYWDARHNVFAFVLKDGRQRFSDDGEPHGTAGKPVLDVISGSGVTDVAVVVTRYFGGVLLGTGGLVRAYSKAAKDGIDAATKVRMLPCTVLKTVCAYAELDRLQKIIRDFGGSVQNARYGAEIELKYQINCQKVELFAERLRESFSGQLTAEETEVKLCGEPISDEDL